MLVARQLVDTTDDQEVAYREYELGHFFLEECRDLPPMYDQLSRRPVKDGNFFWRCRTAAEVASPTP